LSGPVALQALITGLAAGATYGLIALGFSLVHRLTGVIAFAHGDIVVGAVFAGVLVVVGTMPVGSTAGVGTSVALLVVAVVAGALLSVAVYVVAVRPFLGRGDVVGWVAGGLAAGLLVRELLGLPFSQQAYALPDPLGGAGVLSLGGGVTVPVRAFEVLALGLVVGVAVERALALTGAGAVVRAVSDDARAAALLGIPTERVVLAAFALAGGLAGFAGLLIAPAAPIGVDDGVLLGLKGITAALLGRLGSLPLALAGGLVLGVSEAYLAQWDARLVDVVPLAALAVIAALRPRGLLAK
jgi:branched-subunit amino acid ABC-type transport system permease component